MCYFSNTGKFWSDPAARPARGKMPKVTIDFVTVFLRVKIDAKIWDMLCDLKIFVSSDLSGVKIDAKNGDMLGNFKVFV